jgi:hypothetical protein
MVHGGERQGLALEASEAVRVRCKLGWQRLDRDVAMQLSVTRFPNLAHSAAPYGRQNFVMAKASAGLHRAQSNRTRRKFTARDREWPRKD